MESMIDLLMAKFALERRHAQASSSKAVAKPKRGSPKKGGDVKGDLVPTFEKLVSSLKERMSKNDCTFDVVDFPSGDPMARLERLFIVHLVRS